MNKPVIKNFAIWARNKLIADISYRSSLMGITEGGIAAAMPQSTGDTEFYDIGAAEPYAITGEAIRQRCKLAEVIRQKEKDTDYKTAYRYIIEEVAYTWFNRLIAVRFMEVNDYLPSHIRVLSSESGKLEPDLVTTPFEANLSLSDAEKAEIVRLKQDNKPDEAFHILFIRQCNALNEILPALFEATKDYTELLLSLSVIDKEGIVYHLVHDIPEDDFNIERGGQVEIIGWLYQYYNTEPKAAAFAKNGKITKEEIPAVTQLFTPDWIVRYMVENSLGRLWAEGHPDCGLKENWKYYLEEVDQEPGVQAEFAEIRKGYSALNPEDIKLIDPCMGSGHILVYAFDVLMQIYESAGYSQRDAVKSILEHNLYGLDIDDRAYQLAYFAVMMKARQYNRRILNGEIAPHVYAIQESNHINREHLRYLGAGLSEIEKNLAEMQMQGLLDTMIDAKEYGSILNVENYNWELLRRFVAEIELTSQITMDSFGVEDTVEELKKLIDIAEAMSDQYWVSVTNPPYMGISNGNAKLNEFVKKYYPDSKSDLFAIFIERLGQVIKENGYQAMITQHAWMFLSSYEKLREKLQKIDTVNMAHLGARAFEEIGGEVVQTASFVMRKSHIAGYKGTYCRLIEPTTQNGKEEMFLARENRYTAVQDNFAKVPGSPVAYWLSEKFLTSFSNKKIADYGETREGITTANNELFLKMWFEVSFGNVCLSCSSQLESEGIDLKWYPHHKGGEYRKWYGNHDYIIDWQYGGKNVQNYKDEQTGKIRSHNYNLDYIFKEYATWSRISSENVGLKYSPKGFTFDSASAGLFLPESLLKYGMGFICSCVAKPMLNTLNPTIKIQPGDVADLPFVVDEKQKININKYVENNIVSSKIDWDSFETSWDFVRHPLVALKAKSKERCNGKEWQYRIENAFFWWNNECEIRFQQVKSNEEELNRIFIEIYGLQDELTPEVDDKDITVRKADLGRDIRSLISYAVGCMFGRYSLDVDGIAFAGGDWDDGKYETFVPDKDNILPITDEEYFADDIVNRLVEFVKAVYGKETLEDNLDFLAQALGNKGNTSREVIRNYFLKDFYTDHLKIYQKRPIYWLFDSGKQNGFKALIYLHRYTPDTVGNLRIDYLHRLQRIYESEIERMQDMIDHSDNAREASVSAKRKEKLAKQLKECREYDEKISHLALSRIELDLDDGVKANYRKLQTAYDGKFYEVLAASKNN